MNPKQALEGPPSAAAAGPAATSWGHADHRRRFYRSADVAKAFGVTQQTVRIWVRRGELEGAKIGGVFLLDATAVDRRLRSVAGPVASESARISLASEEPANPWDHDAVLVVEYTPPSGTATDATAPGVELESVGDLPFREVLAKLASADPAAVEVNPRRLHGTPAIRGTRIPVSLVLHYLAEGQTLRKILTAFPNLSREQVLGAVDYAARLLEQPVD